jgi:hypothetical protein
MEVRVGIQNNPRELFFESNDDAAKLTESVQRAIDSAAAAVVFKDDKGRTLLVPTAAIAYVEIGAEETRRVGFIA